MTNVLITGAGVDKTAGLDFPLANQLLAEVSRFIKGDGKEFDEALRSALPNLRFDFNRFINQEIEGITRKDIQELREVVESIHEVTQGMDDDDIIKKKGTVISTLFNKLVEIQASSQIDNATYDLIREAFGDDYTESDFIIDIHKMSLSDTFKSILKHTLKESLSENSNAVANAMSAKMLDIEQLLIQKFLGFYNQNGSDVRNYIYISWCLWGYLVWKQQNVLRNIDDGNLPFYGNLPANISVITLNYTTFLENAGLNYVNYFHGGLGEYVRMDTRQILPIELSLDFNLAQFITNEIKPNIDLSPEHVSEQRHVIPSLVPPLKLKPILSHNYIKKWSKAADTIHQAQKIVVVGYSFNSADEHFNDIIRNSANHNYDIIAPDAISAGYMRRIEKVFGVALDNFTNTRVQEKLAKTTSNIRLISARADEVNIGELFNQ